MAPMRPGPFLFCPLRSPLSPEPKEDVVCWSEWSEDDRGRQAHEWRSLSR